MSDLYNGLVVVLKKPINEAQVKLIKSAIMQIKGVVAVEPHVENLNDIIAIGKARHEFNDKMWTAWRDIINK